MTDVGLILGDLNHGDKRGLEEILNAKIPQDAYGRFMIAITLVKTANKENFDSIIEYIMKPEFSDEYSLTVVMEVTRRNIEMCDTKGFVTWAKQFKSIELF